MQGYDVTQSSTAYPLVFLLIASSDHLTGFTGATVTVTLSKSGAAFAAPSGAVSEIGNGWYKVAGNATDTGTLGPLALHATATGADPSDALYPVVAYSPQDAVHLGLSALPNTACTTNASLLTSGTGTDQISVSAGKLLLQATQTGVTIPTVTTVTNQLTAAAIATAHWQDTTAGDFTVASSIGKSLYTSGAVPGASGGLLIAGTNAGATSFTAGIVISNTSGYGLGIFGGSGYDGINVTAGANANGITFAGVGNGSGLALIAGSTGNGVRIIGGTTSGTGLQIYTFSGDGVSIQPTGGSAIVATANGSSKHGMVITGGAGGTSDGIRAVAGTGPGGVDIRGNITGNLIGTLSTLTTYTGDTPQTGDSYARLGAPSGASIDADILSRLPTSSYTTAPAAAAIAALVAAGSVASVVGSVGSVTAAVSVAGPFKINQASGFEFALVSSIDHATPFASGGVTGVRSIAGGAEASVTGTVTQIAATNRYYFTGAAADFNGTSVGFCFSATGADSVVISVNTTP
jgi:hypothetical protein